MNTIGRIWQGPVGPWIRRLALPGEHRDRIAKEAVRAGEQECCGLLIGRVETRRAVVTGIMPAINAAEDPRSGFEIDPEFILKVQRHKCMSEEGILGHYHSHPSGPVTLSHADRDHAWVPGHVWLIAAPDGPGERWTFSAHLATEEKGRITLRPLEILDR